MELLYIWFASVSLIFVMGWLLGWILSDIKIELRYKNTLTVAQNDILLEQNEILKQLVRKIK